jgi:hypothetical protein
MQFAAVGAEKVTFAWPLIAAVCDVAMKKTTPVTVTVPLT